jgi:hypothetical protein
MHAASIEKSERLGRVLDLLSQGGEFSTLDIIKLANVCAVNSIVAELRQNGCDIDCQRKGEKWFYRLNKIL